MPPCISRSPVLQQPARVEVCLEVRPQVFKTVAQLLQNYCLPCETAVDTGLEDLCPAHLDNAVPLLHCGQDVGRLEVAVPHIVGVQVLDCVQHLPHQQLDVV